MKLKIFGLLLVFVLTMAALTFAGTGGELPVFDDGSDRCQKTSCQTTCTGPMGVECCCYYVCMSGGTWVCHEGEYCDNTDRSCIL